MNAKTLLASALAAAVCAVSTAISADLTVANGSSQTIDSSATYGTITVNGDLHIANGVTITCTKLTVSDNIGSGKTARLFIGDNAKLTVTGESQTLIGVRTGRAEVYIGNNAELVAQHGYLNMCWGYSGTTTNPMTEALMVVGTNSLVYVHTDFFYGHGSNKNNYQPSSAGPEKFYSWVVLEPGARLQCQRISCQQQVGQKIIFNGGRIVQTPSTSYSSGFIQCNYNGGQHNLILEGTNGCPVHLELKARNNYASLYDTGGKTWSTVRIAGDGGFLKTGAGDFPILSTRTGSTPVHFQCTGDVVIREGGLSVGQNNTAHNVFRATVNTSLTDHGANIPVNLVVECGATFDLAGSDIAVNSLTAMGIVTNSAASTKTATVGVLDDGRDSYLARIPAGVDFVKQGDASLTLCGNDMGSLDVQGGTLVLKDRATMGYPLYRFKFDSTEMDINTNLNNSMRIKDVAFLADGQNVTRPYKKLYYDPSGTSSYGTPEYLFDGDLNTVFEDYRMCPAGGHTIGSASRDRVQVSIEYPECRVLDGYRWAPYYSPSSHYALDPTAWRVFGGFSPTDGDLLDQVTGYVVAEVDDWTSTNFVLRCPVPSTLHVGTLTLASGVKINATGAQVSCDTFSGSATGVELDLSSGATLPLTANQGVSEITVDLTKDLAAISVLNPDANGEIHITGGRQALKGDLLHVGSCTSASRLHTWAVYINGERARRTIYFENGALRLTPESTMMIVR